jgi:hypothetical protein
MSEMPYSARFYERQREEYFRSAMRMLPHVLEFWRRVTRTEA